MAEIIIRAAAFDRLVNTIVRLPDIDIGLLIDDTEVGDVLQQMKKISGALAIFQTNNMELLSRVILRVVRLYGKEPKLHNKIKMLYGESVAFVAIGVAGSAPCNRRVKEILDLSDEIYEIYKKIKDTDVSAETRLVEIKDDKCHPESEFARFTIKKN